MHVMKWMKIFFDQYKSCFLKRDNNKFVFGAWWGEKFADNPKYLFLYCVEHGMDATWITKSKEVYEDLKGKNLPVEYADSEVGINICKHAKYYFTCTSIDDINKNHMGNAVHINLWHGLPLKKIVYDDDITGAHNSKKQRVINSISSIPLRKDYVLSSGRTFTEIYKHAFRKNEAHILPLGQPRNDAFFNGMLKKQKYANVDYQKMILYMPTHRNEGNTPINIEEIFDLQELNTFCADNKMLFIIKKHFYHAKENTDLSQYSNIVDLTLQQTDAQELLLNADILITDYSSCYIDYLLLNRPIIFYAYDYEHYLQMDREMYFKYEDVTPGGIYQNFKDFMSALHQAVSNQEYFLSENEPVKNLFYDPECQMEVSARIMENIKEIK